MKGSLTRLLCAMLAVSSAHATIHSGKTYLLQRSQGVNLANEYVTWHKHVNMPCEDRIGGSLQVVPFYHESKGIKDAGKYFGRDNGGTLEDFVGVGAATEALQSENVFHISNKKQNGTTEVGDYATHIATYRVLKDQVKIDPSSSSVGARFDYHQKLDALLEGLFFKINVPVVNNKTSVNAKSVDSAAAVSQKIIKGNDADFSAVSYAANTGAEKSLLDYLAGNVSNDDAVNAQDALKYGRIVPGSFDKTGVADVELVVGYNFLQEDEYHVGLNLGVTFPTGTKPTAVNLFEPRVGTNHWGFGAGFDAGVNVWSSDCWDLELMLIGNYRYLFKDKEMRTAGDGKFSQYKLGDKSDAAAQAPFFPIANVTTQDYDVTPGSQFDMIANVAFTWSNFTFDLGYNLYFREEEKVELRDFVKNVGVAVVTAASLPAGSTTHRPAPTGIVSEDEFKAGWLASMQTPRQLTHKVYAAGGYSWNDMEYPVILGVFGGYEFTDNAACEQWHVGGKVGVTF